MRVSLVLKVGLASISMLAPLSGCSSPTSNPTPQDANVTADVTADVSTDDVTSADSTMQGDSTPADTVVVPDVPTDPDSSVDGYYISPAVGAHVSAMSTMGWAALNRSRSMMMYGCAAGARAQDCLSTVPLVDDSSIGANRSAIPTAHLRLLYSATTRSNFWTRSSADGRFVGRGVYVHDLSRDANVTMTGAMYDPAFFPDNSGYIYQPGGRMCPMSSLTEGDPTSVRITAAPCVGSTVGLYQHLGASLDGADYWATSAGTAAWDDGGHSATLTETRRNETWGATAQTSLSLMANNGSGFTAVGSRSVTTPFQGDAVVSPSSKLIITRFVDPAGAYQGYVLHQLNAAHTGAAIMASITEIARYPIQGAKPAFSYDERFVVYHHYVGGGAHADADAAELGFTDASDAGFAEYHTQGASNVYVLDLRTGVSRRVTTMGPGQYALYPHFRSDGWIYFIVRTLGTTTEHVIASDAALSM